MSSKHTTRKTLIVTAIALAAAAPAFATSAPSEWAGYPTTDSVQFGPQPASLATTANIVITPVQPVASTVGNAPADTSMAQSSAGTDTGSTSAMSTPAATSGAMRGPMTAANMRAEDDSTTADASTSATVAADVPTWTVVLLPGAMADATPATLPQWQQPAITRESVRAEVLAARADGRLTPANEVGDTEHVLAARQKFNEHQTDAIVAEYQAEYDRQVALQEAEARRVAIETDWLLYGMTQPATNGREDGSAEVQIDVISLQPAGNGVTNGTGTSSSSTDGASNTGNGTGMGVGE